MKFIPVVMLIASGLWTAFPYFMPSGCVPMNENHLVVGLLVAAIFMTAGFLIARADLFQATRQ